MRRSILLINFSISRPTLYPIFMDNNNSSDSTGIIVGIVAIVAILAVIYFTVRMFMNNPPTTTNDQTPAEINFDLSNPTVSSPSSL